MQIGKKTYSVEEAAQVVGISARYMYELIKTAGFPAFRIGRRWLVSVNGLERWLEAQINTGGAAQ